MTAPSSSSWDRGGKKKLPPFFLPFFGAKDFFGKGRTFFFFAENCGRKGTRRRERTKKEIVSLFLLFLLSLSPDLRWRLTTLKKWTRGRILVRWVSYGRRSDQRPISHSPPPPSSSPPLFFPCAIGGGGEGGKKEGACYSWCDASASAAVGKCCFCSISPSAKREESTH